MRLAGKNRILSYLLATTAFPNHLLLFWLMQSTTLVSSFANEPSHRQLGKSFSFRHVCAFLQRPSELVINDWKELDGGVCFLACQGNPRPLEDDTERTEVIRK